jgi:hypothetical protein
MASIQGGAGGYAGATNNADGSAINAIGANGGGTPFGTGGPMAGYVGSGIAATANTGAGGGGSSGGNGGTGRSGGAGGAGGGYLKGLITSPAATYSYAVGAGGAGGTAGSGLANAGAGGAGGSGIIIVTAYF